MVTIIIIISGIFCISKFQVLLSKHNTILENSDNENIDKDIAKDVIKKEDNIKAIEVVATGDFLIHKEILETQYNNKDNTYDFKNTIQYVKNYLNDADLTIANLEGTLSGIENYGYSGYPSFNAPDELADAMKWAGVDVVNNMNNHSLD
ncbi:CapA family protein, partial [Clostridium perfringens]